MMTKMAKLMDIDDTNVNCCCVLLCADTPI